LRNKQKRKDKEGEAAAAATRIIAVILENYS
jgi:hypothetical protein